MPRASASKTASASDRAAHKAIAKTVAEKGHDAPRALYAAYEAFNRAHFGGKLGAPLVFVGACSSPRALGDYCGRDIHGLVSRIRIAEKTVARGVEYASLILLHEMVHAWCQEILGDLELGYRGHGPKFAAKCNEIGRKLGLREVGVKGRKGLPDCAQWPLCVMDEVPGREDDGERGEGEEGSAKTADPKAPACLCCGKVAKLGPFCGAKCAASWALKQTEGLAWCPEHRAWTAGACAACDHENHYEAAAE